jgi:hypothetical protein
MIIKPAVSVLSSDRIEQGIELCLSAKTMADAPDFLSLPGVYAYSPLINSHDHLVGNWVPKAGDNRPYVNSHIWVEDMKDAFAYQERSKFWINDGKFELYEPTASKVALLGVYKNLFSGCAIVQDHAPRQKDEYYSQFPLQVVKDFRQCHSITLHNWWGGESPQEEMRLSKGKMPFIIHIGEGVDEITKGEFQQLLDLDLLKRNTLMIHGIALTEQDLEMIAAAGASVCWCPTSNQFLIGKTLMVDVALRCGVNVVLGTDSTMSGGINLIDEFLSAKKAFPTIASATLYKMVTENAAYALMLDPKYAFLDPKKTDNLLLIDKIDNDPFENLLQIEAENINLLLSDGIPRFGNVKWMDLFDLDVDKYTIFRTGKQEKFVLGDPLDLNDEIDAKLGYHKDFPYLPF